MTAQPVRARHFPGKPAAEEVESASSEEESESEEEQPKPYAKPKPAPLASTFPRSALKANLAARQKQEELAHLEDEFETESEEEESGESGSESGSEEESEEEEEEESSSEEEARPKFQRPVFIKKNQRYQSAAPAKTPDELAAEEEQRRQEQAKALVQAQIEQRAARSEERRVGKECPV